MTSAGGTGLQVTLRHRNLAIVAACAGSSLRSVPLRKQGGGCSADVSQLRAITINLP